MALIVKAFNDVAAGIRADLGTIDHLFVSSGATVTRTDATLATHFAVTGQGSSHLVEVQGTIVNFGTAVALGDDLGDINNRVVVGEDGYVGSMGPGSAAINFLGRGSSVLNHGTVNANHTAINFGGNTVLPSHLENHGSITANTYGVRAESGNADILVENTGTIVASTAYSGSEGIETIINTGLIEGIVDLGDGVTDDLYDGRDGRLVGEVRGEDGNDTIYTGIDNDFIDGGEGADMMVGGRGNDTYVVNTNADKTIEKAGQGADTVLTAVTMSLANRAHVENLTFDTLAAVNGTGNALANTIQGGDGANKLFGLGGNDKLFGNAGNEWLRGGLGADRLTGGTDADRFEFRSVADSRSGSGLDKVMDFSRAEGDRFHLAAIDADTTRTGNNAFTFIGKAAFSGNGGELRYQKVGSDTRVLADTNGDHVADMTIVSDKVINFIKGDFVL